MNKEGKWGHHRPKCGDFSYKSIKLLYSSSPGVWLHVPLSSFLCARKSLAKFLFLGPGYPHHFRVLLYSSLLCRMPLHRAVCTASHLCTDMLLQEGETAKIRHEEHNLADSAMPQSTHVCSHTHHTPTLEEGLVLTFITLAHN